MTLLKAEYHTSGGQRIQVCQGDLTDETTDAIVNAANKHLLHGGGVAGAILRRGGDVIQDESDSWVEEHGPVPTGQVAVTGAGSLGCRYIIHAVGPIWSGGQDHEEELLHSAVWQSLLTAHTLRLTSIALPALSSGIFGFPKDRCAQILVETAQQFYETYPTSTLQCIRFTNIDDLTTSLLQQALDQAPGAHTS